MNRELIMNQRLTRIIMHLDEKTILFSLVELTCHLRAVVAETKVNCVTIVGVAQRWHPWPHVAMTARPVQGRSQRPWRWARPATARRASHRHTRTLGLGRLASAPPDVLSRTRRRGEAADRRGSLAGQMLGRWAAARGTMVRSKFRDPSPETGPQTPRCGKALGAAPRRWAYQGPPRLVAPAG
jgi:hypothetical protein